MQIFYSFLFSALPHIYISEAFSTLNLWHFLKFCILSNLVFLCVILSVFFCQAWVSAFLCLLSQLLLTYLLWHLVTETTYLWENLFSFSLDIQLAYISEPSLQTCDWVLVIKYEAGGKCRVQVWSIVASHIEL